MEGCRLEGTAEGEMKEKLSLIPKLTRREFFKVGGTSFVGFHLLPMAAPLQVRAEEKVNPRGTADCCIFLFLMGGPPQLDTFDLKEGKWTPPDFDVRTMNPTSRCRMPCSRSYRTS